MLLLPLRNYLWRPNYLQFERLNQSTDYESYALMGTIASFVVDCDYKFCFEDCAIIALYSSICFWLNFWLAQTIFVIFPLGS